MSWCVECYDSNHVCWYFRLPVPINLTLSIVKLRNCNRNFSLFLSSWSIYETLLHLIYIASLMAGIALFAAQLDFLWLNYLTIIITIIVSHITPLLPYDDVWKMMSMVIICLPQTCWWPPVCIYSFLFSSFHHHFDRYESQGNWI